MHYGRFIVFALAAVATCSANAAGLGLRAGSTGVGVDIGFGIAPTLSARIGYSGLKFDTEVSTTDVNYDTKVKLSNPSGLIDWSPLGPFRITAGIVGANGRADLTGTPSGGTFTINGISYQASDIGSLSGSVKAGKSAAPYLGFGYGNVAGAGVNFYFDVGVIFQGSPKVSLTANCGPALTPGQCTALQGDVEAERRKLEDDLSKYKYYPVVNIGVTIGF